MKETEIYYQCADCKKMKELVIMIKGVIPSDKYICINCLKEVLVDLGVATAEEDYD